MENDESGPAGPWGQEPIWTYLAVISLRLQASADHLATLATLLKAPVTLFGPANATRASLEASGRAFWLLDPKLSLRSRIKRSLNERLASAHEAAGAVAFLIDNPAEGDKTGEVRTDAEGYGLEVSARLPPATGLVGDVLEDHVVRPKSGRGLYKLFSAISHGTMYGALQMYTPARDDPGEGAFNQRMDARVTLLHIRNLVQVGLAANVSAFERAIDDLGRDRWAWNRWKIKIKRDLERERIGAIRRPPGSPGRITWR